MLEVVLDSIDLKSIHRKIFVDLEEVITQFAQKKLRPFDFIL